MQIKELVSQSPSETINVAKEFAKTLKAGMVVAFQGDLGSGKTTFMKGLAEGLGLKNHDEVKSPTFVIMHCYPTKIPIYHFDLYRFDTEDELDAIDFDEFLNDPKAISCIEWAEKAPGRIPKDAVWVTMKTVGDQARQIVISKKVTP